MRPSVEQEQAFREAMSQRQHACLFSGVSDVRRAAQTSMLFMAVYGAHEHRVCLDPSMGLHFIRSADPSLLSHNCAAAHRAKLQEALDWIWLGGGSTDI